MVVLSVILSVIAIAVSVVTLLFIDTILERRWQQRVRRLAQSIQRDFDALAERQRAAYRRNLD